MITQKGTEEDLRAVIPTKSNSDNDNSLSKTDGVANQIQATSDETPAHDETEFINIGICSNSVNCEDELFESELFEYQANSALCSLMCRPAGKFCRSQMKSRINN
ncbi:hypothetical protein PoB_005522300 [Plakobranchus ocellatus]|uniref:Uncharacterized protein n=1 Tax=Plakobranchus ocellatus TaxID=259542 RepID=A0AAV4CA18_9GAST|nr:hypothetical protein PoB_005522300 [Plakobranchus ocellatus]